MKTNHCAIPRLLAVGCLAATPIIDPAAAATEIGGVIGGPTTLTAVDSPYLVTTQLEVPEGTTLTIEPGVLVQFALDRFVTIRGRLEVAGIAESPVIFTDARDDQPGGDLNGDGSATAPEPGGWGGLLFLDGASGDLRHAEIRYAGFLGQWFGLWHQGGGALSLSHCKISDTAGIGAWLRQSTGTTTIDTCTFVRCSGHGLYLDGSPASLVKNTFSNNQVGLMVEGLASPLDSTGSFFAGNSLAGAMASDSAAVDARNSWWGHLSGPRHAANPDGEGDVVGDGILFEPWHDGIPRATVTVSASPAEGGGVSGGGTFEIGTEVTVSATPAGGYGFEGWFEGETEVATTPEFTFNLAANRSLTARFSAVPLDFTITASAGTGGFIEPSGPVNVEQGGSQFFVAYPENGYDLEDLIVDGVSQGPGTGYYFENVQSNHTIHATFRMVGPASFTVGVSANDPALGSLGGAGTFPGGSEVTVTATASAGAEFLNWTEDGSEVSTAAEYSFVLTQDRELVANFASLPDTREYLVSYGAGPNLSIPRNAPVQRAITDASGRPLVICGTTTEYVSLGNCEIYDPVANAFTTIPMNSVRGSSPVIVRLADGRHLIAGGDSDLGVPASNTAEIYDPAAGTFTPTGSMNQVRATSSGILLDDGRALVVGAWYRSYANTGELYDPDTGTFSQPSSTMSEPRTRPALLPRADGKVLVLGGYAPYSGAALQSLDLFDPATDSFSPVSSGVFLPDDGVHLSTRQDYLTPLGDGTILVMGHAVVGQEWRPRAMIYDPQTGTFTPTAGQPPKGFYAGPQWLPQQQLAVCTTLELGEFGIMLYDPEDGGFHIPGETFTLPANHTMGGNSAVAVLPDGRLLVAGGTQRTGSQFNFGALPDTLLVSIEVRDPVVPVTSPWTAQVSGTEAFLNKVFFIDEHTGWTGGSDWSAGAPVLLKTRDGGTNWQALDPGPGSSVAGIRFFDADHGWILVNTYGQIDSESRLMETTDGGATWTTRFTSSSLNLESLHFLDSQHGWACGSAILRTTDGGVTWVEHSLTSSWYVNDLHFTDALNGWVAGSDNDNWTGLILKTTDGGITWTRQTIHDVEHMGDVMQVHFHNATEGIALGGHGVMLETDNGGADWHPVPDMPFGIPAKIAFPGDGSAWMVGSWFGMELGPPYPEDDNYSIMGSTDGGTSWVPDLGLDSRDQWLSDCHFPSPDHGWAVGENGTILRYHPSSVPPPPGYADWALLNFTPEEFAAGLHEPGADPGALGVPNLTRYALALGAREPKREWLPRAHQAAPGPEGFALWVSLPDPLPPDVECLLGASATLADWIESPMSEWQILGESTAGGRRDLLVRPPAIPGDGSTLFLNLILRLRSP